MPPVRQRSEPSKHAPRSPKVLEIYQTWNGLHVDTLHARHGPITAGLAAYERSSKPVNPGYATVQAFVPGPFTSRVQADLQFSLPGLSPGQLQEVFRKVDGQWFAHIDPAWTTEMVNVDAVRTIDDVLAVEHIERDEDGNLILPISDRDWLNIHIDRMRLRVRLVDAAKRVRPGPILKKTDTFFLGLLSLTSFMGATLGLLAYFAPPTPDASLADYRRFVEVVQPTLVAPPDVSIPEPSGRASGADADSAPSSKPEDPSEGRHISQAKADKAIADQAGLLGFLSQAGASSGMGGEVSSGLLEDIGAHHGPKYVGVGWVKGGTGPGGTGEIGSIGMSGPRCPPGSTCRGLGPGTGPGLGGTKPQPRILTVPQDVIQLGNIDRAMVDQVIKQNLAKFKYCYQRQVQRNPSLKGKVVSRFVIAGDGTVSKAETKSSTISPAVDNCVAKTMARLQFPKPKGGGIAIVSYPFVFSTN